MQQNTKKNAGVWLDSQQATIIATTDQSTGDYSIQEKIKAKENHGGGSEHSMNNAKQSDNLKFFKSISAQLMSYDSLLIFGPGKLQEQFQNYLQQDGQFKNKQVNIDSADKLTDPQIVAKVRDFFK